MEKNVEKASKKVDLTEKGLLTSVTLKDPTYTGLEFQLAKFRDACSDFILLDWQAAALRGVEDRLWEAHSRVNAKFRPYLAKFRENDGKKKHVERRKAEKLYLDFIKSTMRFYRGLIQQLASHFKAVPQLFDIVRKFSLDTLSADEQVVVDPSLKQLIVQSCHMTLIHLGDLSRWRETELNQKQRNWGPAKGYYDLATALDPTNGMSFNQLAVISLADNDHLRAVYYFYRALCIGKPAPQTLGNLELEFKKVIKYQKRGDPLFPADPTGSSNKMVSSFLTYHAACYMTPDFADHEEQLEALIADFKRELRTKPFDSSFRKMCVINIAAVQQSQARKEKAPELAPRLEMTASKTQSLNVGICTMLFGLLTDELHYVEQDQEHLSPLTRRLLPLLRLYSAWIISNAHVLGGSSEILRLWTTYAEALSLLISEFQIQELPNVSYLLDEDLDIVEFTAFSDLVGELHFRGNTDLVKPSRDSVVLTERLSPNQEMLCRIRALVIVGLQLSKKDDQNRRTAPLTFASRQFHLDLDSDSPCSDLTNGSHKQAADTDMDVDSSDSAPPLLEEEGFAPPALEQMVKSLVESKPSRPYSQSRSPEADAVTIQPVSRPASMSLTVNDFVRQMQQPSPTTVQSTRGHASHRTSLPSIQPSPFTPRPGEDLGGSRPGTAHQPVPPSTAPLPHSRGTFEFHQQIAQMKHDIQARTSPITAFDPTPSLPTYYETPTGLGTFIRNQVNSSPWERSLTKPTATASRAEMVRETSQASPFGAIGERARGGKTPISGQHV